MSGPCTPSTLLRDLSRSLGLTLAITVSFGCASTPSDAYLFSLSAGQRAQHAGRYEEAAELYTKAAVQAERRKDRDEALFLKARVLQRADAWQRAEATYAELAKVSPNGPRTIRAKFELATLKIEARGDETGYSDLTTIAVHNPDHGVSRMALTRVLKHYRKIGGDDVALRWLESLRPRVEGTELSSFADYERARCLESMGQLALAHDAYIETASTHAYPLGPLTDDALWHAADLAVKLNQPALAIEHLEWMLSVREEAHTMGSYERPRFSQSRMRIAEIYRDHLSDRAKARASFHRVYTEHRTSVLRDDALWEEAKLYDLDGDREGACDVLEDLVEDFPDSRYAACASTLCPSQPSPAGAVTCRAYILRTLEPKDVSTHQSGETGSVDP